VTLPAHGSHQPFDPLALVSSLVPAGITASGRLAPIDQAATTPYPEEEALVATAGTARRADVLTGRSLARAALGELGAPAGPLGRRPDRSPDWPVGFGGSISHAGGWCLVVVARLPSGWSVGIDLERDEPLPAAIVERVLRPDERTRLAAGRATVHDDVVVFSAKEAVFKAVNPSTGRWLEHHDVDIDLAGPTGRETFTTSFPGRGHRELGPLEVEGRWRRSRQLVATGCVVHPRR
jgi:4'-phosphopantetheinyl transferase EntD